MLNEIKKMIENGDIVIYNDDKSTNIYANTNIEFRNEEVEKLFKKYLTGK